MTNSLVEIPIEQWPQLRKMYEYEKQHSNSYNMLHLYITRVKNDTDINARIYSLNDHWQKDGLFLAMSFNSFINFNILTEDLTRLSLALSCLQLTKPSVFFSFRHKTRPAVINFFEQLQLNPNDYEHSAVHWHYASKEIVDQWEVIPSDEFSLKELNAEENAQQINAIWPHKSENSVNFVKLLINKFPSIGAYEKHNKLVAWCLMLPTGALGLLQVEAEYKRKGLGSLVVKALSKKFVEEGFEVLAPVVTTNTASLSMFKSLGFEIVDQCYWQNVPAVENVKEKN